VSEIDGDGTVLSTFTDVKSPHHLCIDSDCRIFVADLGSDHILMLNSELQLIETYCEIQLAEATRVCYNELKSQLYVIHSSHEQSLMSGMTIFNLQQAVKKNNLTALAGH